MKLKNLCDDKSRAKRSTIVASLPVKKYGHQRRLARDIGEVLRRREKETNNLKPNVIVPESQTRAITSEASVSPPTHTGDKDADFQAVYNYMMRCQSIADFRDNAKAIHHILEQYDMHGK